MAGKKVSKRTGDVDPDLDRLLEALENVSGDLKIMLTNPFNLGNFMDQIAKKDDPAIYIPVIWFVALLAFVAELNFREGGGSTTMFTLASLVTFILLVFRSIEKSADLRKKE